VAVRFGNRKPPTSAYASFSPPFHYDETEGLYVGGMFWDGRARDVVEQAKGPFLNPLEQNNPNRRSVILKVRRADYADLFRDVFGPDALDDVDLAYDYVAQAIATYEASDEVNQFTSKYDYYLAGVVELTEQEMRGLELYEGPAMCSACHPSQPAEDGTPPLFTDFTYDNLGVPRNPENPFYDMPPYFNPDGEGFVDLGLGGNLNLPDEMGKMKVPTLRNVGMRPYEGFVQAYTHNGFFKSLRDIVDFYNTRDVADWPPPEYPYNVNEDELGDLGLSDQNVDDIVAFLMTLTDGYDPFGDYGAMGNLAAVQSKVVTSAPVRIRFALPEPSIVNLAVHDVSGRVIRDLSRQNAYPAGPVSVSWDGRDRGGAAVGSGVYFVRIDAAGKKISQRLVLVR
jgi:cytochrome c peroxidase